jgi:uncharacterized pyridoxamine 5'-phosphate oxidase family protein
MKKNQKYILLFGIPLFIGGSYLIYRLLNNNNKKSKNIKNNPNVDLEEIDENLQILFQNASNYISNNKNLNFNETEQLKIYALFKQVKLISKKIIFFNFFFFSKYNCYNLV